MSRPKKHFWDQNWPDNWQTEILSLYEQGASDVEIKGLIWGWLGSFSNDLWERWLKEEPIFSETIKKGKLFAQIHWERMGRERIDGDGLNPALYQINMRNRYGWDSKTRIMHEGALVTGERLSEDEANAILKRLNDEL